jgi:hypothetical protein
MPRPTPAARQQYVQGQILLERAFLCVGCEVIFAGMVHCPRCGGGTVWPLAEWLRSARLSSTTVTRQEPSALGLHSAPRADHTLPEAS